MGHSNQEVIEKSVREFASLIFSVQVEDDVDRLEDIRVNIDVSDDGFAVDVPNGFYDILIDIRTPITYKGVEHIISSFIDGVVVVSDFQGRLLVTTKMYCVAPPETESRAS